MSETALAFGYLVSTAQADSQLVAAATGGVWQGFAPVGITAPVVVITQQDGRDVLTANVRRLFTHLSMQIKAIGPATSYATLVTIADRIDALFKRVGPTALSSGGVLSCYREQLLAYEELVNGVQWSHLGGLYHIELQGS